MKPFGHIPSHQAPSTEASAFLSSFAMLALDVTLLTEKLQHQSLEENVQNAHNNNNNNNNNKQTDHEDRFKDSIHTSSSGTGGKKGWTGNSNARFGKKMALNREYTIPSRVDISFPCSHVKPSNTGSACDNVAPALSSSRPKKRHSQSLNTHSENDRNFPPAKSTWQPQGSRLWKPVGLSVSNKSRNCHISNFQKDTLHSNFTREFTRSSTDSCFSEFSSSSSLKYKQVDSGHITPEDFITPPESPIPRPSSASTCICSDGAISPLDYPYVDSTSVYCLNKHHAFRNRSLSFEDQISSSSSCSGSVASVPNSVNSMPSSPHRHKIQRCRSQPSFYRERKSGKRRRLHGRPNLNLLKMKETAYGNLRSDCFSIQVKDQFFQSQFCADLDPMMKLMPIASSPLDTDLTAQRMMAVGRSSPIHELEPLNRDSVIDDDDPPSVTSGPIKLIGDDEGCDFMEEEEVEEPEMFAMQEDLDIEQIENH